jgi:ribosomal-protein-alanine N-acetyltransferase
MSARLRDPDVRRVPLTLARLDEVLAIEQAAYPFPWTRGNFIDSLAARYLAEVLLDDHIVVGYFVAMPGVGEMHLLNLTVAPAWQGRGHGRALLDALVACCRARRDTALWLEVRESNARARAIYARYGFVEVGSRRGYYPAPRGQREDAVVMSLEVDDVE